MSYTHIFLIAVAFILVGCDTLQPVDKPCGVLDDSLGDVRATTADGNRRIDDHFEVGVRAGCWTREMGNAG